MGAKQYDHYKLCDLALWIKTKEPQAWECGGEARGENQSGLSQEAVSIQMPQKHI